MSGLGTVWALVLRDLPERACTQRGWCCQFQLTGREPYVTRAELDLVLAELRRQGRCIPPAREDGACPLWSSELRHCTVYEARPMGCRTFYCREAGGPVSAAQVRDALHALSALDEARGRKREGSRPLTRALHDVR